MVSPLVKTEIKPITFLVLLDPSHKTQHTEHEPNLYYTSLKLARWTLSTSLHCRFKLIACPAQCPPSTAAMRWRWAYQVKCRAKNIHLCRPTDRPTDREIQLPALLVLIRPRRADTTNDQPLSLLYPLPPCKKAKMVNPNEGPAAECILCMNAMIVY